jgi:cellulose synthase/poly-beta-1,6-N-acetylglucosamine synthase-like glycosyltransferase
MTHVLHQAVLAFNAFVIVYMLAQYANQLILTCFGWREISEYVKRRQLRDYDTIARSELSVPVSLVIPAYNEEAVILESVRSLLRSHYAAFEVVVVNDGSTDRTLEVLLDEYDLVPDLRVPRSHVKCEPVIGSYRSLRDERLVVIDKRNGGSRADAMNAGLQYARYPLFLAVDADTLLDVDALPRLVREFQVRPETVGLGGIVRIANGSTVEAGHVTEARTPRQLLVNLQIVEYLRAFLVGRTGWSRLGAILIVSGAFGIFRREDVVEAGGYDPDSFAEDAELVLRLHRMCRERGRPYRIGFIADPVCWTEAPSSLAALRSQRNRWQRGLLQVLWRYRQAPVRVRRGVRASLLHGLRGGRSADRGDRLRRHPHVARVRVAAHVARPRLLRGGGGARHRLLVRRAARGGARVPALPEMALLRPARAGRCDREPGLPPVVRPHPRARDVVPAARPGAALGRDGPLGLQSRGRPLVLKSITSGTPSSR